MKLERLKINKFGKLENKEIEFCDRINIIYGKNESGKSTLLKFVTSMLYGLSKNKNGKNIPDFEKYTPWEEGDFSGKLSYKLDNGRCYEVFRDFNKKNPKLFDENLNDISKEYEIDKTKGSKFFFEQVKVDEETFLSSIVCEQQDLKLDKQTQSNLIQKTANLIGTGDDNISFDKVINKLNKKQIEEIGTQRTQDRPINVVENLLNSVKKELENIQGYNEEQYIIEKNNEELKKEACEYEKKIEILKEIKKIKENEILEKERLNINKNSLTEFDEEIEKLNSQINELDKVKEENLKENNKLIKFIILPAIFVIVNIILFVALKNVIINIVGLVILIACTIAECFKYRNNSIKIKEKKDKHEKNLQIKNNLIYEKEQIKNKKDNKIKEIKHQEEIINNDTRLNLEKIKKNYINEYDLENFLSKDNDGINYLLDETQNKLNESKLNIHRLKIEESNVVEKLEKVSELKEQEEDLKEKYEHLLKRNNVINIAKEEIEKAYKQMKENISPKFTKNLSNIISEISDGKYKNVKINDKAEIIVEIKNGNYINIENLSIGTIEQLYLSLRLSFVENISNEKLPIMLDEVFAYFDDKRLENILKFLSEKYYDRQIIIFTCTNREQEILNKLNFSYNLIEI